MSTRGCNLFLHGMNIGLFDQAIGMNVCGRNRVATRVALQRTGSGSSPVLSPSPLGQERNYPDALAFASLSTSIQCTRAGFFNGVVRYRNEEAAQHRSARALLRLASFEQRNDILQSAVSRSLRLLLHSERVARCVSTLPNFGSPSAASPHLSTSLTQFTHSALYAPTHLWRLFGWWGHKARARRAFPSHCSTSG